MSQLFSQSKNKKIIVISFQSLSSISISVSNVFELFASFKAANALNHWNLSLIQAVQNCVLVGHIDPHVIMLGGGDNFLEIIKLAWMKQLLRPPLGFTIQYLGELCNFLVSKTPQCSSAELEESVCKCICELVNTGMPSNLKYIVRHVTKFIPTSRDCTVTENDNFLTTEMIKSILDNLQQKGLVYNTGHGYNVMTADKLRVAKWLGELPDVRMVTSGSDYDDKRPPMQTVISDLKSSNRFLINREHSENTEDCLSCYDLRGNKYYSQQQQQPTGDLKSAVKDSRCQQAVDRYRVQCLDSENNNREIRVIPTDSSVVNKSRMLCSNIQRKETQKRPSCVKYESNLISRIICGMKKLRIHWPTKNGVVRSTNIGVADPCHRNIFTNYSDDTNVINSRLSQSMYAFNQIIDQPRLIGNVANNRYHHHSHQQQQHQQDHNQQQLLHTTKDSTINEQPISFIPYAGAKSISPVAGCNGVNYLHGDIDRSFMLIDEQRCCSELMLTGRSSVLSPNIYSVMPLQAVTGCDHTSASDATKTKPDRKDDLSTSTVNDQQSAIPSMNNRYFSPFTCDSGFNSVHGAGLPEIDTSQSKTSSPPDLASSKMSNHYNNCQQSLYGGPCAWQISSLNDSVYQSRSYPNAATLAPVIESSRYVNR